MANSEVKPGALNVSFKVNFFTQEEFEKNARDIKSEKAGTFGVQEVSIGRERMVAVMGRTIIDIIDA